MAARLRVVSRAVVAGAATAHASLAARSEPSSTAHESLAHNESSSRAVTAHESAPVFDMKAVARAISRRWRQENGGGAYGERGSRWYWLDRELSSNVAGETGAVFIYVGARQALRLRGIGGDSEAFCSEHVAAERAHLAYASRADMPQTGRDDAAATTWTFGREPVCAPQVLRRAHPAAAAY